MNYLPQMTEEMAKAFAERDYARVRACLGEQSYERVGLDRAMLILDDIAGIWQSVQGYRFLDVGCNNGWIGHAVEKYGNVVIGVENGNIDSQQLYDTLREDAGLIPIVYADIADYLRDNPHERFDFTFLLSVVHQWEFGYAQSGFESKGEEEIAGIMRDILSRTTKAVYMEGPVCEPGLYEGYTETFLDRFLPQEYRKNTVFLCHTVASNGYLRALYRIRTDDVKTDPSSEGNLESLRALLKREGIDARIIRNGNQSETRYAALTDTELIISANGVARTDDSIYGAASNCERRAPLWQSLIAEPPAHVNRVYQIYDEAYVRIECLRGFSGSTFVPVPDWLTFRMRAQKRPDYSSFLLECTWLADLAQGLAELHARGIAHGDAFPFNCIVNDESACWVDLSNLSDSAVSMRTDLLIFLVFCVHEFLGRAAETSDSLISEFASMRMDPADTACTLRALSRLFRAERTDVRPQTEQDAIRLPRVILSSLSPIFEYDPDKEATLFRYLITSYAGLTFHMHYCDLLQKQIGICHAQTAFERDENRRLRVSRGELYHAKTGAAEAAETLRLAKERIRQLGGVTDDLDGIVLPEAVAGTTDSDLAALLREQTLLLRQKERGEQLTRAEIARVREQHQQTLAELNTAKDALARSQAQIDRLTERTARMQDLQAEIEAQRAGLEQAGKTNFYLSETLSGANLENERLNKECRALEQAYGRQAARLAKGEAQVREIQQILEDTGFLSASKTLRDLRGRVQALGEWIGSDHTEKGKEENAKT